MAIKKFSVHANDIKSLKPFMDSIDDDTAITESGMFIKFLEVTLKKKYPNSDFKISTRPQKEFVYFLRHHDVIVYCGFYCKRDYNKFKLLESYKEEFEEA